MRKRTLLFVFLAVFCTVGTVYIARTWLNHQQVQVVQETKPAQPEQIAVLVASHDLPTGSFLRPEDLRWQVWPEGQVADNYLIKNKDSSDALTGAVVRLRIAAGEPVTNNRVLKPGDRGFLAAVLNPGMRAISVSVTAVSGISGLVFPGDHVDLILSHQIKEEGQNTTRFVSETVQSDLRILAIDQSTVDVDGKPTLAHTVTFEVTPKQVEAIEVASTLGTLYLSLRGIAGSSPDDEAAPANGVRSVSHTLDSDVSPLVGWREEGPVITILRGQFGNSGGASTVAVKGASAPAPAAAPAPGTAIAKGGT